MPEKEDILKWLHDNKGEFSVKRMSELLIADGEPVLNFGFDKIWKLKVLPMVNFFCMDDGYR